MLVFAGVPVSDYASASDWYERLFGRAPDVIVAEDECMWQIAEGGWVYVVADRARAGNALVTILVDNLDAFLEDASRRDIYPKAEVEVEPGKYRKSTFADPDGNSIAIGEALKPA